MLLGLSRPHLSSSFQDRFADDSLKQCLWELTIDNAGITANANYAM